MFVFGGTTGVWEILSGTGFPWVHVVVFVLYVLMSWIIHFSILVFEAINSLCHVHFLQVCRFWMHVITEYGKWKWLLEHFEKQKHWNYFVFYVTFIWHIQMVFQMCKETGKSGMKFCIKFGKIVETNNRIPLKLLFPFPAHFITYNSMWRYELVSRAKLCLALFKQLTMQGR